MNSTKRLPRCFPGEVCLTGDKQKGVPLGGANSQIVFWNLPPRMERKLKLKLERAELPGSLGPFSTPQGASVMWTEMALLF